MTLFVLISIVLAGASLAILIHRRPVAAHVTDLRCGQRRGAEAGLCGVADCEARWNARRRTAQLDARQCGLGQSRMAPEFGEGGRRASRGRRRVDGIALRGIRKLGHGKVAVMR